MKAVGVDIYEELTSASIEEEQRLNVSVVNYVLSKSKTKSGQSKVSKIHTSKYLLSVL